MVKSRKIAQNKIEKETERAAQRDAERKQMKLGRYCKSSKPKKKGKIEKKMRRK